MDGCRERRVELCQEIGSKRVGIPENRVMVTRWILKWEKFEPPAVVSSGTLWARKAKARLVAKGFTDPDLVSIR
eukprot:6248742-Lingulodinium_polyedra.AAC.1